MVINDTHNFIFVHVYRTGGSSMDRAFPSNQHAGDTHRKLETVPNWKNYFSFGFVRNPWDRTVSSYMYATATKKISGSFEQYVNQFRGQDTKKYAQYNMVKNCSYIGRFERLNEDIDEICNVIGLPTITIPHIWKTEHKHYSEYYTDELKEIVHEHQSGDIEQFGFSFDTTAIKNIGTIT